jgi:hypothetical protein
MRVVKNRKRGSFSLLDADDAHPSLRNPYGIGCMIHGQSKYEVAISAYVVPYNSAYVSDQLTIASRALLHDGNIVPS